jgi:hypothetical protein
MATNSNRIAAGVERGAPFTFTVDGQRVEAYPGETVAGAMLAAGRRLARRTAWRDAPRGPFCLMGVCHDCRMIVDGAPNVRTCLVPARPGMRVETQQGFGPAPEPSSPGTRAADAPSDIEHAGETGGGATPLAPGGGR